ncbi:hypothetical protein O0L34_g12874 [Tuta absoluta]|nr:hypothetical protein O0L34_g12874 [Tuta absoluta]
MRRHGYVAHPIYGSIYLSCRDGDSRQRGQPIGAAGVHTHAKRVRLLYLIALDASLAGFGDALRRIDACGSRGAVTAHVFCVRAGQTAAAEIVANAASQSAPQGFIRMLRGLGNPVLVRSHPGWTGHVDTSYDAHPDCTQTEQPISGEKTPALYDGREQVLYWSDATNEIAFVVPSGLDTAAAEDRIESMKSDVDGSVMSVRGSDKAAGSCWDVSSTSSGALSYERSISESDKGERGRSSLNEKVRALSLELDKQPAQGNTGQWVQQGNTGQWVQQGNTGQWVQQGNTGQWVQQGNTGQWVQQGNTGQWVQQGNTGQWVQQGNTGQWVQQGNTGQWVQQGNTGQWVQQGNTGQWVQQGNTGQWVQQGNTGQWVQQGNTGQWVQQGNTGQWVQQGNTGQWVQQGNTGQWVQQGNTGQWVQQGNTGQWVQQGNTGQWVQQGNTGQWVQQGNTGQWVQQGNTGSVRRNRDFTSKILIIWLEDFEDHLNVPIDDLLRYCETGLPWRRHEVTTIFVSARRSGLIRVRCAPATACGVLADGAVIAPQLLPACLRRAALDVARRSRLNTDLYQPPHVRRRHLIQELAQNYKRDLTEPELLESLFRPT